MDVRSLREVGRVTEALRRDPDEQSDAALIEAVRRGDVNAYGVLYERHLGAAKRAAVYLATTNAEREDLVAEAFTRVLQVLRSGRGPAQQLRPYLLVTMRHAAINAARRSPTTALYADVPDAYLPAVTEDPVAARLRGDEAASAFAELPERWRQVLWHTEVEGASPASIAPMLGMTPNGVAALAYRAREGLRQAYLKAHLPQAVERSSECRAATDKLAGWVRRSISAPQRRRLTAHLNRCERCSELAAGLREVNGDLGATATPIVSWLSMLKGALTAKLGAAAAIAAITAITVVASEPLIAHEPAPPATAGPVTEPPTANRTNGEIGVRTTPSSTPTQAPQPAPGESSAPTTEPVATSTESTTATAKEEKAAAKEEKKAEKAAAKEEKKAEKKAEKEKKPKG
jgi:RNA polymerase sigma factor (sigma-70 family)